MSTWDQTQAAYETGEPGTITPLPAALKTTASAPVAPGVSGSVFRIPIGESALIVPSSEIPAAFTVRNTGNFLVYITSTPTMRGREGFPLHVGESLEVTSKGDVYANAWTPVSVDPALLTLPGIAIAAKTKAIVAVMEKL